MAKADWPAARALLTVVRAVLGGRHLRHRIIRCSSRIPGGPGRGSALGRAGRGGQHEGVLPAQLRLASGASARAWACAAVVAAQCGQGPGFGRARRSYAGLRGAGIDPTGCGRGSTRTFGHGSRPEARASAGNPGARGAGMRPSPAAVTASAPQPLDSLISRWPAEWRPTNRVPN